MTKVMQASPAHLPLRLEEVEDGDESSSSTTTSSWSRQASQFSLGAWTDSSSGPECDTPRLPAHLLELSMEMTNSFFLNCILRDERARGVFLSFLEKRHCEENLIFWMEAEVYRKVKEHGQRKIKAEEMVEQFIREGARHEINISAVRKQEIIQNMEESPSCLFSNSQKDIFLLMVHGTFDFFLRSQRYKQYKRQEGKYEGELRQKELLKGQASPKSKKLPKEKQSKEEGGHSPKVKQNKVKRLSRLWKTRHEKASDEFASPSSSPNMDRRRSGSSSQPTLPGSEISHREEDSTNIRLVNSSPSLSSSADILLNRIARQKTAAVLEEEQEDKGTTLHEDLEMGSSTPQSARKNKAKRRNTKNKEKKRKERRERRSVGFEPYASGTITHSSQVDVLVVTPTTRNRASSWMPAAQPSSSPSTAEGRRRSSSGLGSRPTGLLL
ncbi:hypothetical protein QOT17_007517 [Balamuthia mandrillaris]